MSDTLIYIRSLTGPRTSVVFDENHSHAIPQCLLDKQLEKRQIATWQQNAYVLDPVHSATPTCHQDRTEAAKHTSTQDEIPIPTSPILSDQSIPITNNSETSLPDLKIAISTLANTTSQCKRYMPENPRPKHRFRPKKVQTATEHLRHILPPYISLHNNPKKVTAMDWNLTLNHASLKRLKRIAKARLIPNLTLDRLKGMTVLTCSACRHAAHTTTPKPPQSARSSTYRAHH